MAIKPTQNQTTLYGIPLRGFQGVSLFCTLVLLETIVSLIVCSQLMTEPIETPKVFGLIKPYGWEVFISLRPLVFQVFIICLGLAWCAFTACNDLGDFFLFWLGLSL